jgi:hypothetical protein
MVELLIMASYVTFRESSNHHQNQGISQISLSDEYSKSQLDVKLGFWHQGIPNLKNFPPIKETFHHILYNACSVIFLKTIPLS